jgi:hypothetical protein
VISNAAASAAVVGGFLSAGFLAFLAFLVVMVIYLLGKEIKFSADLMGIARATHNSRP